MNLQIDVKPLSTVLKTKLPNRVCGFRMRIPFTVSRLSSIKLITTSYICFICLVIHWSSITLTPGKEDQKNIWCGRVKWTKHHDLHPEINPEDKTGPQSIDFAFWSHWLHTLRPHGHTHHQSRAVASYTLIPHTEIYLNNLLVLLKCYNTYWYFDIYIYHIYAHSLGSVTVLYVRSPTHGAAKLHRFRFCKNAMPY